MAQSIASYPVAERELIVTANVILSAIVKIGFCAQKPQDRERLINYLQHDAGLDESCVAATVALVMAATEEDC